VCKIAA
jgi:hypothetical protein